MKRWIFRLTLALAAVALAASSTTASAQVTTGSIRGIVTDAENKPLPGARIIAVHLPSGTQYVGATRADGRFNIPGMRIGGPYSVAATSIGYARQNRDDLQVTLGAATDLIFTMSAVATQLSAVTVTSEGGELSSTRTGAATSVRKEQLEQLPTISRRLVDFTRLTPQANGTSFAGADNRLNNITIDGAFFNNSFGLGTGETGGRTRVAPISLDAIEAVQVSIAPFDVRQGYFVGAAVNTVTRSGTNEFTGSVYTFRRDESSLGRRAGVNTLPVSAADVFNQIGFRVGGPLVKNKLFFHLSYESDNREAPLTTFRANRGGETVGGNVTRVLKSDMDTLSAFLQRTFGYVTGPFEGMQGETPSDRLTARLDYALNERNKFTFRYSRLNSTSDVILNSSTSALRGRPRNNNYLSFEASNHGQDEIINSVVGEWNSLLTDRMSNQMIIGYAKHDESRPPLGELFPLVDIFQAGDAYTSFGSEPFTPNNELRYNTLQFQNNFTIFGNRRDLTFGVAVEAYESENIFFPMQQSGYQYASLADFYADANAFIAACGAAPTGWDTCVRPTAPVSLGRFQLRYNNILGSDKPVQPLQATATSFYAQDEWRVRSNLTVTTGLRVDITAFGKTQYDNDSVRAMTFRDPAGQDVSFNTATLPQTRALLSPRLGFNYDVRGNSQTIVRGGTGLFTGRPLYVWISNQIGNNGLLLGFVDADNTTAFPFHPNPDRYLPPASTITNPATPAATYNLALTRKDFRFPQVWRSNLGIDHKFASGWRGTVEFLYSRDVNGMYYYNANLPVADGAFTGPDQRLRWFGADDCPAVSGTQINRLNCRVTEAIVLGNQNVGWNYNAALSLERQFDNGLFTKFGTSYGQTRNSIDPGSIAGGSFSSNAQANDPNNPALENSSYFQGARSFLAATYVKNLFGIGNTTIAAFIENFQLGPRSYIFSNDVNGDGATNDLIYIPRDTSEMNFAPLTAGTSGPAFTSEEQAVAWNNYINQDPYLSSRRGQYAKRNAFFLPRITRMDLSVAQDFSRLIGGKANTLSLRMDILNFTNMINSDWGLAKLPVNDRPLAPATPSASGTKAGWNRYTLARRGSGLLNQTFTTGVTTSDVWTMQLGFRYTFN